MEFSSFKVANTQKAIFLISFFVFLLFGLEIFAAVCIGPPAWNKAGTCTVDIYYEDPSGGSDLDGCYYTTESGVSPTCPTGGSWDSACSCKGEASITCPVTISIGPTGDCNINGEGTCKICSKATDGAGNTGYGELSLNIDFAAPGTAIECNETICSAGWYNVDVSITLFCSDSHSGCDKTYYCIDQINSCSPGTLYTGAFNLTAEGTNYVRYYSTDIAGNIEPTKSKTIKLDKTGPISQFTDVATPEAGSTVTSDFDVSTDDWDRPLGVDGVDNSSLASCYYSVYDSGVGWAKSGEMRDCNSSLSFTVTVGPSGDCQTIEGTCTVSIYAYDIAGNPGDGASRTFNIAEPSFICNISVPTIGVINQWIEINTSGSQGAIAEVRFASNLVGGPTGSWTNWYDWNVSSGNWDATRKTMKWSFAAAGTYEVWAEVKDSAGLTRSCYDTILIMECYPGQTKTCTSPQGCSHTLTCQSNGTWPSCPTDTCTINTPDSPNCPCPGIDGCVGSDYYDYPAYGDCNSSCSCNLGTAPGAPCAPTIYANDPRCVGVDQCDSDAECEDGNPCTNNWCERPADPDSVCLRDNLAEGTSCGICKKCDGSGHCINRPDGYDTSECGTGCQRCVSGSCQDYNPACGDGTDETSCECISDICIDCSTYYDGGCGYRGICFCGDYETPVWSCLDGECQCECIYNEAECGSPPPECTRKNPEVYINPTSQEGAAGETLTYTVWVTNQDQGIECGSSTFSLAAGEYCNEPSWTCSLDLTSLTINSGQSDSTTLWATSPSNTPKGDKDISVTAQNIGFPEFFGTGYATYEVLNNRPSAVNLSASPEGICFLIHPFVRLSWTFDDSDLASGDYQSAREVEIFSDPGYNNLVNRIPEPDLSPGSTEYTPNTGLSFNTTYYWRVRVWDNEGALSDCGQPEGWCYPEQLSFHTEKEWPWPDFSVTPPTQRVYLKERVEFTDESTCYDGPCNLSPTANYLWEFGDGGTSLKQGNTSHIYLAIGNYDVTLTITDEVGQCTSDPITVTVTRPLPEWMEIPPF